MAILLRRNAERDPWFEVHSNYVNENDIVELDHVDVELPITTTDFKKYPPTIKFKIKDDSYLYTASLNCFDYVRDVDHEH